VGDESAAAQLVQDYEPVLRIEIRRRLRDPYLNSSFDSDDVCQSVLKSFFLRAAAGQYDLHSADDLSKLLIRMVKNKVADKARQARRKSRDPHRVVGGTDAVNRLPNGAQPIRLTAGKELLERFRELLTEQERRLADLRAEGRTWPEIASLLGGQAQTHRHQLDRALVRVLAELGLEEGEAIA
jgi:RNA polymerase sigma-70 factor (ECF subfamily)